MTNNRFMGTFNTESEVLRKIEELKNQGISEDHMYVMAHDKEQLSMVRGRTDVDYKSSEGGWMDKFMGFLSGNESVHEAFSGMGIDDKEADGYYRDVQNGKILLFVDQEIGSSYSTTSANDRDVYGDAANNTSTTGAGEFIGATNDGEPGYGDSGMVGRDGLTVDTNDSNDVNYHRERGERGLTEDDDLAASQRQNTNETAGVGEDTGTGFGLGREGEVDSGVRSERESERLDTTGGLGRDTFESHDERLRAAEDTSTTFSDNGASAAETEEERLRANKDERQTADPQTNKRKNETTLSDLDDDDLTVDRNEHF